MPGKTWKSQAYRPSPQNATQEKRKMASLASTKVFSVFSVHRIYYFFAAVADHTVESPLHM